MTHTPYRLKIEIGFLGTLLSSSLIFFDFSIKMNLCQETYPAPDPLKRDGAGFR